MILSRVHQVTSRRTLKLHHGVDDLRCLPNMIFSHDLQRLKQRTGIHYRPDFARMQETGFVRPSATLQTTKSDDQLLRTPYACAVRNDIHRSPRSPPFHQHEHTGTCIYLHCYYKGTVLLR